MKIVIIAVGKEKDFSGYEIVSEYAGRVSHHVPCEWRYIPTSDQKQENEKILEALDKDSRGSHVIALDEKGKELDSRAFADKIQWCMNESVKTLFFVIGGSYGLTDEVRSRAQAVIALSRMTFPHQLVRLVLVEQIYRAFTIMRGEKYHH